MIILPFLGFFKIKILIILFILLILVSTIPEASPRSEKPMTTTDQVTAMCQQMSLELAFLTNSTENDDFPEKFKTNDLKSVGKFIN